MKIRLCAPTDEAAFYLKDAIKVMKENGIYLAEIRDVDGINVLDFTDAQAKKFYQALKDNHISVWAISSPIGKRDINLSMPKFKARVLKAIKMAKIFHAPHIRVFSFFDHKNNAKEVAKRLKLAATEGKKAKLKVCLENEKDSYCETPERVIEILDMVPGLLSVYDSSNYVQVGVKSSKTLKMTFPRAYYVHFKDGVHKNNDADITPVGEGEANIAKLISLVKKDMVFSIEHHLRFPRENETYKELKGSQKFIYHDTTEAFVDAVKHARKMLKQGGYQEGPRGTFIK